MHIAAIGDDAGMAAVRQALQQDTGVRVHQLPNRIGIPAIRKKYGVDLVVEQQGAFWTTSPPNPLDLLRLCETFSKIQPPDPHYRKDGGTTFSLVTITDGLRVVPLGFVQKYWRQLSGGLIASVGSHTLPCRVDTQEFLLSVLRSLQQVMYGTNSPYRGFLNIEFGQTDLYECTAEFGSPEAQVILPASRAETFADLCRAAAFGTLSMPRMRFLSRHAVCITLRREVSFRHTAAKITGCDSVECAAAHLFPEGMYWADGWYALPHHEIIAYVVGTGHTIHEARTQALVAAGSIRYPGVVYESDIGLAYI